jgi:hypothetical protein
LALLEAQRLADFLSVLVHEVASGQELAVARNGEALNGLSEQPPFL